MYCVGKLTLQRKELCFISETEMCVTLLTDANPGHVFHFLDDSAVWHGREGVGIRQEPLQVNSDTAPLPHPFNMTQKRKRKSQRQAPSCLNKYACLGVLIKHT